LNARREQLLADDALGTDQKLIVEWIALVACRAANVILPPPANKVVLRSKQPTTHSDAEINNTSTNTRNGGGHSAVETPEGFHTPHSHPDKHEDGPAPPPPPPPSNGDVAPSIGSSDQHVTSKPTVHRWGLNPNDRMERHAESDPVLDSARNKLRLGFISEVEFRHIASIHAQGRLCDEDAAAQEAAHEGLQQEVVDRKQARSQTAAFAVDGPSPTTQPCMHASDQHQDQRPRVRAWTWAGSSSGSTYDHTPTITASGNPHSVAPVIGRRSRSSSPVRNGRESPGQNRVNGKPSPFAPPIPFEDLSADRHGSGIGCLPVILSPAPGSLRAIADAPRVGVMRLLTKGRFFSLGMSRKHFGHVQPTNPAVKEWMKGPW
jgi:hypothetical protein